MAAFLITQHSTPFSKAEDTVIPLFIFSGQSNMVGYATNVGELAPQQLQTQNSVLFYATTDAGTAWSPLTPPTQIERTITGHSFGPEISVGQTISTALGGALVAEVKLGKNGSTEDSFLAPGYTTTWDPETPSNLFADMVTRATEAKNSLQALYPQADVQYAGFFWMQGESDAQFQASADAYEQNLMNFTEAIRLKFGSDIPIIIGQIRNTLPYSSVVRAAEVNVAASVPNTFLVFTDDLPLHPDGIHFNSEATYILGERMAQGYLSVVPEPTSLGLLVAGGMALAAIDRRGSRKG